MKPLSITVFDVLSRLTPFDINCRKLRVGGERDGGYILADTPAGQDVVSFGVGPDVTFEYELALEGRRVFLYDHTVPVTPVFHENFSFRKIGVCAERTRTPNLLPLSAHLANIGDLSSHSLLKMDIEGYEWDVFSTISPDDLAHFDQIVVEMHWFERLENPFFARKVLRSLNTLNKDFSLFHVHANNFTELHIVDGFTVASVIEVSYVRTSSVVRTPSRTLYPSQLNKANHPNCHDHVLLFYPFLPISISQQDVHDVIRRVELELQPLLGSASQRLVNVAQSHPYEVSSLFLNMPPIPFAAKPTGICQFHTDIEDDPWILFEFDEPLDIKCIVVHNRRDSCQERAGSIAVAVSWDGRDFTTVYAPDLYITPGTGPTALKIQVALELEVRFVRLFLRERNYFHLECVEILVPSASIAIEA
jgi:hypothetical protein